MSKFRLRKRSKGAEEALEINVTPMLDMFSVLVSFLLMTAVFTSVGNHRVEIPFLSSKPPPEQKVLDNKPERVATLNILDKAKMRLDLGFSNNDLNSTKDELTIDVAGLDTLQQKLYEIRTKEPAFDKVTVMTDSSVPYEVLIQVVDAMRVLKPNRAPILPPADYKLPSGVDPNSLIPKIVLGNVIL